MGGGGGGDVNLYQKLDRHNSWQREYLIQWIFSRMDLSFCTQDAKGERLFFLLLFFFCVCVCGGGGGGGLDRPVTGRGQEGVVMVMVMVSWVVAGTGGGCADSIRFCLYQD